jgi:hypothetical protein
MCGGEARLGGFHVERHDQSLFIATPSGRIEVAAAPFLRATSHLLAMGLELDGEAELEGGFVFRPRGDRILLRLGAHSEIQPKAAVERFFRDLAGT